MSIVRAFPLLALSLFIGPLKAEPVPVCNLDTDVAFSIKGDEDGTESGIVDSTVLSHVAPAQTSLLQSCGKGTELADTFSTSALRVALADGTSHEFYPFLITDKKPGSWTCNKMKVRTACVVSQQANSDGSVDVALKTQVNQKAAAETHRVSRDGVVVGAPNGRYFVLLPRFRTRRGKTLDRGRKILAAVQDQRCPSRDRKCLARRYVSAERAALMELRRFRMPRVLSEEDREADARALQAFTDQVTGDEGLVHRAIAASEIGWSPEAGRVTDSPFELVDAILGNSGPSYGIHQIDLATNGTEDVLPFRLAMPGILLAMHAQPKSPLQPSAGPVGKKPFAFERPMRGWNIELAAEFYRAVPYAVAAIRTPAFRDDYLLRYRRYLDSSATCMKVLTRLQGVFLTSKVAQLYVVDVANQFGPSRAVALAQAAKEFDGADDGVNEDGMRDYMISRTAYGRTEDGAHDIRRRFDNIRRIANAADPAPTANGGTCNIRGLDAN